MSTAQLTAQRIYDSFRFALLPDDVKRHLAILFISSHDTPSSLGDNDVSAYALTEEEKEVRLRQSVADAKAGRVYTCEEIYDSLDQKYPWLCE